MPFATSCRPLPLFLLLFFLSPLPPGTTPQCHRAQGAACAAASPAPGIEALGWGLDVTTLSPSGGQLLLLERPGEHPQGSGGSSCLLCRDRLAGGGPGAGVLRRLPPGVAGWRSGRRCLQGSALGLGATALSSALAEGQQLARGWKVGLGAALGPAGKGVAVALAGSHSRVADFGLQRQREDRSALASLVLRCELYWSWLSPRARPSPPLLRALQALPEAFAPDSAAAFGELFAAFGTHVVVGARAGGLLRSVTAVQLCRAAMAGASAQEVADCLRVEVTAGGGAARTGASAAACRRARKAQGLQESFSEAYSERLVEVEGGRQDGDLLYGPPGAYRSWLQSLPGAPGLVAAEVRSLHTLLPEGSARRRALKAALGHYIAARGLKLNCSRSCPRGTFSAGPCRCLCAAATGDASRSAYGSAGRGFGSAFGTGGNGTGGGGFGTGTDGFETSTDGSGSSSGTDGGDLGTGTDCSSSAPGTGGRGFGTGSGGSASSTGTSGSGRSGTGTSSTDGSGTGTGGFQSGTGGSVAGHPGFGSPSGSGSGTSSFGTGTESFGTGTDGSATGPGSLGSPSVTPDCCSRYRGAAQLTVLVWEGRGWWGDHLSATDAYVRVAFGEHRARTHTVWNNNRPRWGGARLDLGVVKLPSDPAQALLRVEVWDQDQGWDDDLLGECQVPLEATGSNPRDALWGGDPRGAPPEPLGDALWDSSRAGAPRAVVCFAGGGRLELSYLLSCGPSLGGALCHQYVPQPPPHPLGGLQRLSLWPPQQWAAGVEWLRQDQEEEEEEEEEGLGKLGRFWGGLELPGAEEEQEVEQSLERLLLEPLEPPGDPTDAFGELPEPLGGF